MQATTAQIGLQLRPLFESPPFHLEPITMTSQEWLKSTVTQLSGLVQATKYVPHHGFCQVLPWQRASDVEPAFMLRWLAYPPHNGHVHKGHCVSCIDTNPDVQIVTPLQAMKYFGGLILNYYYDDVKSTAFKEYIVLSVTRWYLIDITL